MQQKLACEGGSPVRQTLLPYGQQSLDADDIQAVLTTLQSDWLTTGPEVAKFEHAFRERVGAQHAVAVNSGTAALHAAVNAAGIKPGDEVLVTPLTFAASVNCVVYQGGIPIFVDVQPDILNIDPQLLERAITPGTRAIIPVDYTGQPCDYDEIRAIAQRHDLRIIEDAAHALGATYHKKSIGSLNEFTIFSTHPVKHITTGEGGVITTDNQELAEQMRRFRNHGISVDFQQRQQNDNWFYEIEQLGYNYRIPDILCALGTSQLQKLDQWVARRREITNQYETVFQDMAEIEPLRVLPDRESAWHIYIVQLQLETLRVGRSRIFQALRAENIGVNVHYIPVYYHPFYQKQFGYRRGMCPVAEAAYERLLTLPLHPGMNDDDVADVIAAVQKVVEAYRR